MADSKWPVWRERSDFAALRREACACTGFKRPYVLVDPRTLLELLDAAECICYPGMCPMGCEPACLVCSSGTRGRA